MAKVLVLATSKKTRGGISAVLKLYERSSVWKEFHCRWVATHRDGNCFRKLFYLVKGWVQYIVLLPFYDIVHIHFSLSSSAKRKYLFFRMAKVLKKKTVIHLHCGTQIDKIWSPIYEDMFEKCDCGILLSESLRDIIQRHLGGSNNLRVVYNPCPIIEDTKRYEKKHQILFSGTLYEGKGYRDLISAFARIAPRFPDWKLVFAGNGEVEYARTLAVKLGVVNQVELLGWVSGERKHQCFCEASFLCLPSYAEGFPMAVLDAWAYGLPVISTLVGGVADVAEEGENMLLFNPGDINVLAEKLEMLVSDDHLREKLASNSYKLAQERFSLHEVTKRIRDIYNAII